MNDSNTRTRISPTGQPSSAGGTPPRAPLPDAWWELDLRTRRLVAAGVLIGMIATVAALLVIVTGGEGGGGDAQGRSPEEIQAEAEAFVASLPPARLATWEALAECETGSDWDANTGNGFYGGLQFTWSSWAEVGGTGNPADASVEEQIMRAEMLLELQGPSAWPGCAGQLGLI